MKKVRRTKKKPKAKPVEQQRAAESPKILQRLFSDPWVWSYLSLPDVDKRIISQLKHLSNLKPDNSPERKEAWQSLQKIILARLVLFKGQEAKLKAAKTLKRKMAFEKGLKRSSPRSKKAQEAEWRKTAYLGEDAEKSLFIATKIRAFKIFYLIAGGVPWKSLAVQSYLQEFELFRESLWGIRNAGELYKTTPQTRRFRWEKRQAKKS